MVLVISQRRLYFWFWLLSSVASRTKPARASASFTRHEPASRTALVLAVCVAFHLRFVLEQPFGSRAHVHPRLSQMFEVLTVHSTTIFHGAYGQLTPKKQYLYSNDSRLLSGLHVAAGRLSEADVRRCSGNTLVKRRKCEDGRVQWTGDRIALGLLLHEARADPTWQDCLA